ncbi:MAG: ATP-dependent Clp protease adaptor ClpS [Cyanobacteria bacterium SZAS-4]|nr:ATP-dependent Clp protease adaptor ClpS [Cyanobacteria bacterium SZAS-4]
MAKGVPGQDLDDDLDVQKQDKTKPKRPKLYKVLLHNDDFTTMEFVVFILKSVFHKNEIDAYKIMLAVHNAGLGVAGVYPYEIAEAKCSKVVELARANEFPLLCTTEEE